MSLKPFRGLLPVALVMLAGCSTVLMSPSGDVALQQRNLIINALVLMLIIIVPVIALTLFFAWRYRASAKATYAPEWDHSVMLELLIWSAPLLIIIALGALTWVSTHKLDPYRSLDRLSAGRPIPAEVKPLVVDVVALDWKWLFIYPEQGIATVNEMAAPVDRPIEFKITSSTMMNSFFVPALAGQIYAMPGMETQLHAVMNKQGQFEGFSANYSGAGFSYMRFAFHSLSADAFDQWVAQARQSGGKLDRESYNALAKPSTNDPVRRYASVAPGLYDAILNLCTETQRQCVSDMMHMGEMRQSGKSGEEHRTDVPGAAQ